MSYIVMLMMIVIVLFAIRLLRREKRSLDAMYGHAGGRRRRLGMMTKSRRRRIIRDRALCRADGLGGDRVLPDLLDDLDLVQAGYAVVRLAAGLFPRPADARELSQCVVRRGGIRLDAIRDLVAEAADLAAQLDHHRHHVDVPLRAVRLGDRLRRVALPDPVRDAHVPASHAAHDSADRRRRAAVTLLLGARPARLQNWPHPDLFPHHAALRGVDDQELHRRGPARRSSRRRRSSAPRAGARCSRSCCR